MVRQVLVILRDKELVGSSCHCGPRLAPHHHGHDAIQGHGGSANNLVIVFGDPNAVEEKEGTRTWYDSGYTTRHDFAIRDASLFGLRVLFAGLPCAAADAPREWNRGHHQRVMDYVVGDCQMTNQIVDAIARQRRIAWRTRKGTVSSEAMPRFKTVAEVLKDAKAAQKE